MKYTTAPYWRNIVRSYHKSWQLNPPKWITCAKYYSCNILIRHITNVINKLYSYENIHRTEFWFSTFSFWRLKFMMILRFGQNTVSTIRYDSNTTNRNILLNFPFSDYNIGFRGTNIKPSTGMSQRYDNMRNIILALTNAIFWLCITRTSFIVWRNNL